MTWMETKGIVQFKKSRQGESVLKRNRYSECMACPMPTCRKLVKERKARNHDEDHKHADDLDPRREMQ